MLATDVVYYLDSNPLPPGWPSRTRPYRGEWLPPPPAFNGAIVGTIEVISEHRAEAHGAKKETVET